MSDETRWMILESIYEGVRSYARIEFAALTRKIIHRMQRVEASGIFGDDYIFKTLWDEYCHRFRRDRTIFLEPLGTQPSHCSSTT